MRPFEVMVGKIVPYLVIGVVQMSVILLAAHFPEPTAGTVVTDGGKPVFRFLDQTA